MKIYHKNRKILIVKTAKYISRQRIINKTKNKIMKTIIATEISEGIENYIELYNWIKSIGIDPDNAMFNPLSLMESDPNRLKCEGRELYFIDVDLAGTKFVLTSDEVNEQEKKMLTEFHQDDFKKRYSEGECNWETFDKATNAVAYRGGKGYVYTIWLYKQQTLLKKAS